jgi:hypothetical protein
MCLNMGIKVLLAVDCSPFLALSAIVSKLFPFRDRLKIFGHQDFTAARATGDESSAINSPDVITDGEGSLVTKLYAVLRCYMGTNFWNEPCAPPSQTPVLFNQLI